MNSKYLFFIVLALGVAFSVYLVVWSETGIVNREKIQTRIEKTEAQISKIRDKNKNLRNDIYRLQTDEEYIKALAKTHGFRDETKKEKLIIFVEDTATNEALAVKEVARDTLDANKENAAFIEENENIGEKSYVTIILFIAVTIALYVFFRVVRSERQVIAVPGEEE